MHRCRGKQIHNVKDVAMTAAAVCNSAATTVMLWRMTDWGIGRVVMSGITISWVSMAAVCIGYNAVIRWNKKRQIENRIAEVRRRHRQTAKFQIYNLTGELIEVPTSDPCITEIRNVMVAPKRYILPPVSEIKEVS